MPLSPTEWTPDTGMSYAEWLQSKGTQTRAGGWTHATKDQIREGRDSQGRRFKATTDQLGNDVIQHGRDQQSVHIKSPETIFATIPKEGSSVEP
jgi:hypothetical protein